MDSQTTMGQQPIPLALIVKNPSPNKICFLTKEIRTKAKKINSLTREKNYIENF
jgi:hypothetical protein